MTHSHPFLVALLACPALLLAGTMAPPAAPSAQIDSFAPPPGATATDTVAMQILDLALAQLSPAKLQWLETTLWQRVHSDDFSYQAEGRFLAAPGQRRRLRLHVTVGQTWGEVEAASD